MNQINIMDKTGHTRLRWNPKVPDEVKMARETFDAMYAKGHAIFRVDKDGEAGERMDKFDPKAKRMIMIPHLIGG